MPLVLRFMPSFIRDLLSAGAHVTPLFVCCANGFSRGVALLLAKGADSTIRGDKDSRSTLLISVAGRHEDIVRMLLHQNPRLIDLPTETGYPPLLIHTLHVF